jgi:hypothetical protein
VTLPPMPIPKSFLNHSQTGSFSRNISSLAINTSEREIQWITQQGRLEGGASGYWTTPVTHSSGFQLLGFDSLALGCHSNLHVDARHGSADCYD